MYYIYYAGIETSAKEAKYTKLLRVISNITGFLVCLKLSTGCVLRFLRGIHFKMVLCLSSIDMCCRRLSCLACITTNVEATHRPITIQLNVGGG